MIAETIYRCEVWLCCLFPKLLDPVQQSSLTSMTWSVEFIPGMYARVYLMGNFLVVSKHAKWPVHLSRKINTSLITKLCSSGLL